MNGYIMQTRWTLQDRMNELEISLRTLARYIAISPGQLSRMINGKRTFRFQHKLKIALVLHSTTDEIQWPDK
jgi:plasmid maintenance system antidote protein VapI